MILYTHYKSYTPIYIPRPEGEVVKLIITGKKRASNRNKKGKMRLYDFLGRKKEQNIFVKFSKERKSEFFTFHFLWTFWILNQGVKKIECVK